MQATRSNRMLCACAVLCLTACDREQQAAPAAAPAPGASVPGLSAAQQPLYDTYCKVCHGARGTGAPLSGSIADWQPRAAAGMSVLLQHSIEGYRGMPPMGGCFACSEDDMRALIDYMSGGLAPSPPG